MRYLLTLLIIRAIIISYDSVAQQNTIILEEFRGHKCGLCPAGDRVIDQLIEDHTNKLIVVAFHASNLAEPNMSGSHTSDYRTTEGEKYLTQFDIVSTPSGMVNRSEYEGDFVLPKVDWGDAIEKKLQDSALVSIRVEHGFDQTINELTLQTMLVPNEPLDKVGVILYITEDSIYDWQTDYQSNPQDISDYLFNHVFRGAVNGHEGTIVAENVNAADSIFTEFRYALNQEWNQNQLSIIGIAFDPESGEYIQGVKVKFDEDAPPLQLDEDAVTSIVSLKQNTLSYYPNPASHKVFFENGNISQVTIYTSSGAETCSNKMKSQTLNLPENIQKGMYLMKIEVNSTIYFKKLVIK